ncbi:hypothetical protein HMPREF9374_3817 [Desmospora sp. 8437]|nr:hypothetical protein HMPREF9374_3817 [Desmospora sp. 8437]
MPRCRRLVIPFNSLAQDLVDLDRNCAPGGRRRRMDAKKKLRKKRGRNATK